MTQQDSRNFWILLIVLAATCAAVISFGIRSGFGLYVLPMTAELGWTVAAISSGLAFQNLMWGAAQPFAGMIADRFGAPLVIAVGALLYASGLWWMASTEVMLSFQISAGFLVGIAQACIGFPIVMGAIAKIVPPERKGLFMGIGTSGGSLGQLLFAPITRVLINEFGWVESLFMLAGCALIPCLLALLIYIGMKKLKPRQSTTAKVTVKPALYDLPDFRSTLRHAFHEQGFLLLVAGFFVCGFQLAFIIVHLPAFAALCGLGSHVAPNGIALIGMFNVIGTVVAGSLGDRYRPKIPLAYIYLARSFVMLPLVLMPVSEMVLYAFSVGMGFLWLSTVPLTNSVIFQFYGSRYAGTLFGVVFFSHQVGSFIGVYASGLLYDATQSYDATWWIAILLGVFAFWANLLIKDSIRHRSQPA